jgi:hypothetical protein
MSSLFPPTQLLAQRSKLTVSLSRYSRRSSSDDSPRLSFSIHFRTSSPPSTFISQCLSLLTFSSRTCASTRNSNQFGSTPSSSSSLLGKGSKTASIVRTTQSSLRVSMYGDCSTINPSAGLSEAQRSGASRESRYVLGICARNRRNCMS